MCYAYTHTLLILIILIFMFCFSSCFPLFARAWITTLYYGVIRNFYLTVSVLFFFVLVFVVQ